MLVESSSSHTETWSRRPPAEPTALRSPTFGTVMGDGIAKWMRFHSTVNLLKSPRSTTTSTTSGGKSPPVHEKNSCGGKSAPAITSPPPRSSPSSCEKQFDATQSSATSSSSGHGKWGARNYGNISSKKGTKGHPTPGGPYQLSINIISFE